MTGPLYVVQFRLKGSLNMDACTFGPFLTIEDAEEFLITLPVAAECEHKYIDTLVKPTRENAVAARTLKYLED